MKWTDVRKIYKDTWVLFEALEAYSENGKRIIDDLAIINSFNNGQEALKDYAKRHKQDKGKEMYVYHTKHENLNIEQRAWIGVRVNG